MVDSAIRKSVRQQVRDAGAAIITFQETCTKEGFNGVECGFAVFKSASTHSKKGKGCEVWINLDVPVIIAGQVGNTFNADDFSALLLEPRLVIVKCTSTEYSFYICSGHAPSRSDANAAITWWGILTDTIRKYIPEGPLCCLGST